MILGLRFTKHNKTIQSDDVTPSASCLPCFVPGFYGVVIDDPKIPNRRASYPGPRALSHLISSTVPRNADRFDIRLSSWKHKTLNLEAGTELGIYQLRETGELESGTPVSPEEPVQQL